MNDLVDRLKEGAPYLARNWSYDSGEMSRVDEAATDELLMEAAREITRLQATLQRVSGLMMKAAQQLETWNTYVISCGHDECGHTCRHVDDLIAELRKEALK